MFIKYANRIMVGIAELYTRNKYLSLSHDAQKVDSSPTQSKCVNTVYCIFVSLNHQNIILLLGGMHLGTKFIHKIDFYIRHT
jgi:hypothetical protein